MAPPNSNECSNKLSTCKAICAELRVQLAEEKTLGPSIVITFLGLELDSVKFEARLPVPKLVKAKSAVIKFLSLNPPLSVSYYPYLAIYSTVAWLLPKPDHFYVISLTCRRLFKFGSSHPYYEIG